jgi:hypothetical protein
MSRVFYDHLIEFEEIVADLDEYELDEIERREIMDLADELLHQQALSLILDHLPPDRTHDFLGHFHECPYDQVLLEFLKKEIIEDIEEIIRLQAQKIKKEILAEINKSKMK